jgi:hypothetical protein
MGLLLIQLAAYRRAAGRNQRLAHLLVLEEAHRLLRNVSSRGGAEENNSAYKAVESFSNLLAEVRAYGQGVVVADQVPTGLAPTVLKNTNLKIIHRLVAADDREAVGASMAMNPAQARHLTTLPLGRAAVFAEGEDSPLLVQIGKVAEHDTAVEDDTLRTAGDSTETDCPGDPDMHGRCCPAADSLVATAAFRSAFARWATSALQPGDLAGVTEDLRDLITAAVAPGVPLHALASCTSGRAGRWLADRRGAQYGWTFAQVESMVDALSQLITAGAPAGAPAPAAHDRYAAAVLPLHRRRYDPFPACQEICPDGTCIFRGSVADILTDTDRTGRWYEMARGQVLDGGQLIALWNEADLAAAEITGDGVGEAVRPGRRSGTIRAALCYAQHASRGNPSSSLNDERTLIRHLVAAFGPQVIEANVGA